MKVYGISLRKKVNITNDTKPEPLSQMSSRVSETRRISLGQKFNLKRIEFKKNIYFI
jgi:hypothetical protein